jgi:hypothetical protein
VLKVGIGKAVCLLAVGVALVVAGVALIYVPAAFIVAGAAITAGCWFGLDVDVPVKQ